MKVIDAIIIHCSATRAGQDLRAKDIDRMHRVRGFNQIGYNFVIDLDGMVENGRPLSIDGTHCNTKGFSESSYNKHSVGVCYIGGLDAYVKPADTRTAAQRASLRQLVAKRLKENHPYRRNHRRKAPFFPPKRRAGLLASRANRRR